MEKVKAAALDSDPTASSKFTSLEKKLINSYEANSSINYICKEIADDYEVAIEECPWILAALKEKVIIKAGFLADPYGMKFLGLLKSIREALNNFAFDKGFLNFNTKNINIIATLLAKYFNHVFANEYLGFMRDFKAIKPHVKDLECLHMNTPLLFWNFVPYKVKPMVISNSNFRFKIDAFDLEEGIDFNKLKKLIRRIRKSVNINIPTTILDIKKLISRFLPYVTHSGEGTLTAYGVFDGYQISNLFLEHLGITYPIITNFDCSGTRIDMPITL